MKCPSCHFVGSELRDICPKCLIDLRPHKRSIGLTVTNPGASYNALLDKQFGKARAAERKTPTPARAAGPAASSAPVESAKKVFGFISKFLPRKTTPAQAAEPIRADPIHIPITVTEDTRAESFADASSVSETEESPADNSAQSPTEAEPAIELPAEVVWTEDPVEEIAAVEPPTVESPTDPEPESPTEESSPELRPSLPGSGPAVLDFSSDDDLLAALDQVLDGSDIEIESVAVKRPRKEDELEFTIEIEPGPPELGTGEKEETEAHSDDDFEVIFDDEPEEKEEGGVPNFGADNSLDSAQPDFGDAFDSFEANERDFGTPNDVDTNIEAELQPEDIIPSEPIPPPSQTEEQPKSAPPFQINEIDAVLTEAFPELLTVGAPLVFVPSARRESFELTDVETQQDEQSSEPPSVEIRIDIEPEAEVIDFENGDDAQAIEHTSGQLTNGPDPEVSEEVEAEQQDVETPSTENHAAAELTDSNPMAELSLPSEFRAAEIEAVQHVEVSAPEAVAVPLPIKLNLDLGEPEVLLSIGFAPDSTLEEIAARETEIFLLDDPSFDPNAEDAESEDEESERPETPPTTEIIEVPPLTALPTALPSAPEPTSTSTSTIDESASTPELLLLEIGRIRKPEAGSREELLQDPEFSSADKSDEEEQDVDVLDFELDFDSEPTNSDDLPPESDESEEILEYKKPELSDPVLEAPSAFELFSETVDEPSEATTPAEEKLVDQLIITTDSDAVTADEYERGYQVPIEYRAEVENLFDQMRAELEGMQVDFEFVVPPAISAADHEHTKLLFELADESLGAPGLLEKFVDDIAFTERATVDNSSLMKELQRVEKAYDLKSLAETKIGGRPSKSSVGSAEPALEGAVPVAVSSGAGVRIGAALVDIVIGLALIVGIALAGSVFNVGLDLHDISAFRTLPLDDRAGIMIWAVRSLCVILVGFPVLTALLFGRTFGMIFFGLEVVTMRNDTAPLGTKIVRSLLTPFSLICFGWLPTLFGGVALHDRLSKTLVAGTK